jgi:hypothetical protein
MSSCALGERNERLQWGFPIRSPVSDVPNDPDDPAFDKRLAASIVEDSVSLPKRHLPTERFFLRPESAGEGFVHDHHGAGFLAVLHREVPAPG